MEMAQLISSEDKSIFARARPGFAANAAPLAFSPMVAGR
jgi:hypothetical protein